MASKTVLLDLPNELFAIVFQYLNAIDLLKSFSNVNSPRLEALIEPFISQLDISNESKEWAEQHLSTVCTKYVINALRLQVKHLIYIRDDKFLSKIKYMHVTGLDRADEFPEEILTSLRQNLKRLSLTVPNLSDSCDLANLLFKSDSQLQHLTIDYCVLYFMDDDGIDTCTRLTNLSVELDGMNKVFTLIQHLPNLQVLKVTIQSEECIVQTPPDANSVTPSKTLRSVTFMGWIKYFDHLETFFAVFGPTIEYLSLNINLRYRAIDGSQLEQAVLNKLPRLSSIDLIIVSSLVDSEPIEIETFQNFTWQQFKPVLYWYDIQAKQHMLFTLPYKFDRFAGFSNDFIENCVSNQKVLVCFKHVRTLSLLPTTPFTIDTFRYIHEVFPNITKIELKSPMVDPLEENEDDDHEHEENRKIIFMNEHLLSDSSFKIPLVRKLCISVQPVFYDYPTFRRLLQLFPNIVCLEIYIKSSLLHDVLKYEHEDTFVKSSLARIEQLNIILPNRNDKLVEEKLKYLFPNVKTLDKAYENYI